MCFYFLLIFGLAVFGLKSGLFSLIVITETPNFGDSASISLRSFPYSLWSIRFGIIVSTTLSALSKFC